MAWRRTATIPHERAVNLIAHSTIRVEVELVFDEVAEVFFYR